MNGESKAKRLSRVGDEIGYALSRGEFPENTIREFRFLWKTTPDQEKDGLSYTLQDIEAMVRDIWRENAILAGAGKLKKIPVDHITGTEQSENNA